LNMVGIAFIFSSICNRDYTLQGSRNWRPLKFGLATEICQTVAQSGYQNFKIFHMQSQLLGQTDFCWATKIVILRSPTGNCNKNAKFSPCVNS
jgi:hypothetical protein